MQLPADPGPGFDVRLRYRRGFVISVHPRYANAILDGKKTVELRRRFPIAAPRGTDLFLYATAPVKALTGVAVIREVAKLPVERIWTEFGRRACVPRESFVRYLEGVERAVVIALEQPRTFSRPLPLNELRAACDFQPPRSYHYAKHDYHDLVDREPPV